MCGDSAKQVKFLTVRILCQRYEDVGRPACLEQGKRTW